MSKDISSCLESRKLVFAGDSTIRQIFWATSKKLDAKGAEWDISAIEADMTGKKKHKDLTFERFGVNLEFYWDPYLNSTKLQEKLAKYKHSTNEIRDVSQPVEDAALILVGGGLWHAKNLEVAPLADFALSMVNVVSSMRPNLIDETPYKRFGALNEVDSVNDLLLVAPVQVPVYERLSPARATTITSEQILGLNNMLLERTLQSHAQVLWSYTRMSQDRPSALGADGLHVMDDVASRQADILLNLRCNNLIAARGSHPYNRTCCTSYSGLGLTPGTLLASVVALRICVWLLMVKKAFRRSFMIPPRSTIYALFCLFLAVSYCFIADRSQYLDKHQKQWNPQIFNVLMGLGFLMGVISIRRSGPDHLKLTQGTQRSILPLDEPFLSRHQSDEWRGWMQFVILIYHYLGASKVLWIYEIVRVLVASYLFMTGFGHTFYFLKSRNYSLTRVASVLVRVNLLSCILPPLMETDYLFYYFAPLVSFWYLVLYFTLRVRQNWNESAPMVISKIVISAFLTTALTRINGILEAIFWFLSLTCRINWSASEWRFRTGLDLYIVYVGMLAAAIYLALQKASENSTSRKNQIIGPSGRLTVVIWSHFNFIRIAAVLLALIFLPAFWALTRRSPNKYDYNWWQPYISFFPILAFLVLRNSTQWLRNHHSAVFARLGRMSLETYTLQFHIWLAGDTKGLLRTGLFKWMQESEWAAPLASVGDTLDVIVCTMVFLGVSEYVACATADVTAWIVDPGKVRKKEESSDGLEASRDLISGGRITRAKDEGADLPRTRSDDQLQDEKEKENVNGLWGRVAGAFERDLRVRLGALLLLMWILNWVSRS
ncbi:hypothetical protein MMC25_003997 [Agyrium rufum]|nr:hypothetical protein [Agyrium rufum]